jgi:hypothetical protein
MTEQTKNSAEASLELRAALHKLEQTMTSGVTNLAVMLSGEVIDLANDLRLIILHEHNADTMRRAKIEESRAKTA